jgi:hypothetical protein
MPARDVTEAVYVTNWPKADGFKEEPIVVEVLALVSESARA